MVCVLVSHRRNAVRFPVLSWPQHKMPMIGHQTIGQNPCWVLLLGLLQNPFECCVVALLLKQRQSSHGAVQRVVHETTGCLSGCTRHPLTLTSHPAAVKTKRCVPFDFSFDFSKAIGFGTKSAHYGHLTRPLLRLCLTVMYRSCQSLSAISKHAQLHRYRIAPSSAMKWKDWFAIRDQATPETPNQRMHARRRQRSG
jgi:hypothetical protein